MAEMKRLSDKELQKFTIGYVDFPKDADNEFDMAHPIFQKGYITPVMREIAQAQLDADRKAHQDELFDLNYTIAGLEAELEGLKHEHQEQFEAYIKLAVARDEVKDAEIKRLHVAIEVAKSEINMREIDIKKTKGLFERMEQIFLPANTYRPPEYLQLKQEYLK